MPIWSKSTVPTSKSVKVLAPFLPTSHPLLAQKFSIVTCAVVQLICWVNNAPILDHPSIHRCQLHQRPCRFCHRHCCYHPSVTPSPLSLSVAFVVIIVTHWTLSSSSLPDKLLPLLLVAPLPLPLSLSLQSFSSSSSVAPSLLTLLSVAPSRTSLIMIKLRENR
jgi:hypothetical protein